jgi:hypothetical protein
VPRIASYLRRGRRLSGERGGRRIASIVSIKLKWVATFSLLPVGSPSTRIGSSVRRHLGVETQRQWSDPAIARTTPALLGLFSLVTLWAHELYATAAPVPRAASWYRKPLPTFADAVAAVRRELWTRHDFHTSAWATDVVKIPRTTINTLIDAACYAA